jgi:signal transduction histidine kinase/CheY-like chemotaxis protein
VEVIELSGQQYVLGLTHDITERKRAEEDRARLESENRQLQKVESLARMAGAIAHLFNNHLAVVIGNLELALMDLSADAPVRVDLIEAMRAARRSADVSGLMLTYLGQTTDKGEPQDLSDICRHNLPMLRDAVPKGVALKTDLLSPGPVARANTIQMRQVLTHLVTNGLESIGHTAGTVTLATRIIPASEISKFHLTPIGWKPAADAFSCLEVTDTGCGMAEEDLDKIFDPFYTTKITGRGMGLAVVLGLVKTWGGAIGVESQQNEGSTFRVFLPLVTGELSRVSEKATEAHQVEQGGTVLLVEDQDTVRKMAESMLKRLGYEVLAASGGTEAVKMFRENADPVRCVITDLSMPGMDGWETLAALRKIRPHIPVILVSGHDEAHAMGGHYPEQPEVFLHKPYLKSDLEAAIDTALKKPMYPN